MKKGITLCIKCLLLILLFICVGCAKQASNTTSVSEEVQQSDYDTLKNENEKLRAELSAANANLKVAQLEKEKLEAELADIKNATTLTESNDARTISIENYTPAQLSASATLIGEWYFHEFCEDGFVSYMQSMVFYDDGTGIIARTFYVPRGGDQIEYSLLTNIDSSANFTWKLNGNQLRIEIETGEAGDFIYSQEDQQIFTDASVGDNLYERKRPNVMDGYVERALIAADNEAKETLIRRKFLGTWYFDLLTWTFCDDGTGTIDIPKLGDQPASTLQFTYSLDFNLADPSYILMEMDLGGEEPACFWPVFNDDGSMSLNNAVSNISLLFTRSFDINNCPIGTEIFANSMSVLDGSIIYQFITQGN